jgi:hypothetical protein
VMACEAHDRQGVSFITRQPVSTRRSRRRQAIATW